MKIKNKYYIIFASILLSAGVIFSLAKLLPENEQNVKGRIEVSVNADSYDYMVNCANKFMELNDKTIIRVNKLEDNVDEIEQEVNKNSLNKSEAVEVNRKYYEQLYMSRLSNFTEYGNMLNLYSKNFSNYRVEQLKVNDKVIGIPLTSRPLALYIRDDMLEEYGYTRDSFNTWDDVIKIGSDIYERSGKKIRIINATGQDLNDLTDLLIMQNLNYDSADKIKTVVEAQLKGLEDNNILNLKDGGEFLARISSINAVREISALDVPCQWSCIDVPANGFGANKFFASEGNNLIILNNNEDNERLLKKFITYVITNNKEALEYVKKGDFFSSYLYTYKNRSIEEQIKNFSEKSPLVVLSNVEEKTPAIDDYDKYLDVKTQLRMK